VERAEGDVAGGAGDRVSFVFLCCWNGGRRGWTAVVARRSISSTSF
jgi:hypothetical protein